MKKYDIKINGRSFAAKPDAHIIDVINENKIPVAFSCGGVGSCGKCKVKLLNGNVEISDAERTLLKDTEISQGIRLACFLRAFQGMELETPEESGAKIITEYDDSHEEAEELCPMSGGYGLAVDIGTTTIAMYLADLSTGVVAGTLSAVNKQKAVGDDVISRINYAIEHIGGTQYLQKILLEQLNEMIHALAAKCKIVPDGIFSAVISANTVITHFLLGLDTRSIAFAPFTPQMTELLITGVKDIAIDISKNAKIVVMPAVSGYVGGDIVAGVLAAGIYKSRKPELFIDIGTNGELVLGNSDRLVCCAVAAGPAFEGSHIECGTAGITGAIDRFELTGKGIEFSTIGNESPAAGLCGSGILDVVSALLDAGLIDETGYLRRRFDITEGVYLTARDVREVQLAKSAIAAGINSLMMEYGADVSDISAVKLAGGFGSYLRVGSALRIKMIPSGFFGKIKSIGNSSGKGAIKLLLNSAHLETVEEIKRKMEYMELSGNTFFQEEFMRQMDF